MSQNLAMKPHPWKKLSKLIESQFPKKSLIQALEKLSKFDEGPKNYGKIQEDAS